MPDPDRARPVASDAGVVEGVAGAVRPEAATVDPASIQASFDRLSAIFADMMVTVEELSSRRCPYKDRRDRCTAQFGCRNQRRIPDEPGARRCAGDDKLDYRSAWETA